MLVGRLAGLSGSAARSPVAVRPSGMRGPTKVNREASPLPRQGRSQRTHRLPWILASSRPMLQTALLPQAGQIARVRQRQYLVEAVVPPVAAGDATLVRLSCLDDDAQGQELEVLWEAELDGKLLTGSGWDHAA